MRSRVSRRSPRGCLMLRCPFRELSNVAACSCPVEASLRPARQPADAAEAFSALSVLPSSSAFRMPLMPAGLRPARLRVRRSPSERRLCQTPVCARVGSSPRCCLLRAARVRSHACPPMPVARSISRLPPPLFHAAATTARHRPHSLPRFVRFFFFTPAAPLTPTIRAAPQQVRPSRHTATMRRAVVHATPQRRRLFAYAFMFCAMPRPRAASPARVMRALLLYEVWRLCQQAVMVSR